MARHQVFTLRGESQYKVYYEDTDFSGFVYHSNYLKFFERAREDLVGASNLRDWFLAGTHFVVARAEVSFLQAARHADTLTVHSICEFSASPIQIYRQTALRGNEILVEATIKIATLNANNRPIRLPPDILKAMQKLI